MRTNQSIRKQLASTQVPIAEIVRDEEVLAAWNKQQLEETFDTYCERIDNPPSHMLQQPLVHLLQVSTVVIEWRNFLLDP